MKLKTNIAHSESGFIFDPSSGNSYTTNPTGLRVIELVKLGKSREEVVDILSKEYEVNVQVLERDLLDFFNMLSYHKLTQS